MRLSMAVDFVCNLTSLCITQLHECTAQQIQGASVDFATKIIAVASRQSYSQELGQFSLALLNTETDSLGFDRNNGRFLLNKQPYMIDSVAFVMQIAI